VSSKWFLLRALCVWLLAIPATATHLRTADIKVEPVCGSPLTFKITVTAYLNTNSQTRFGGYYPDDGHVRFGDGGIALIPDTYATPRPDLGPEVSVATFTVTHTYTSFGVYQIAYYERDRSAGVLNIPNAGDVPYVSFITINIDPAFACNKFPDLRVAPVDRACAGNLFSHVSTPVDAEGDSITYELVTPAGWGLTAVPGYRNPDNAAFYSNYETGNETGNGRPTFSIDPATGLITWDAPGMIGEYNIAFRVLEWRKHPVTRVATLLSATTRDMQIIVEDCQNVRPDFQLFPENICVDAGTRVEALVTGIDPENKSVKIEAVSEVLELPAGQSPASYTPFPPVFVASVPPATLKFVWNTTCAHIRQKAYQVTFKITDDPPFGTRLVTFKTWNIQVVAPPPVWKRQVLDLENRHVQLEWNPYTCANATSMQIWRRVGNNGGATAPCTRGIPSRAGYILVGEVGGNETTFTDTNFGTKLAPGAVYCYRLVATFNGTSPTKSRPSEERCVGPIGADAPVITHVTVEKTSTRGDVRVSWRSPFDIDKTQFPGPYRYDVYRAAGFSGNEKLTRLSQVQDTTFLDQTANSADSIFNYRIVVFARVVPHGTLTSVDTSAVASTVRLEATAGEASVALAWRDSVPWSNRSLIRPWHLIYRGDSPATLKVIDSVNVLQNDFRYVDNKVTEGEFYYYAVMTRGTYGNPAIALQQNQSQITSLYPLDDRIPCKPQAFVVLADCGAYVQASNCGQMDFSSTLYWKPDLTGECNKDVIGYNVYAADELTGEYKLIATGIRDTFYTETGLSSFARCYQVTAVGRNGHESDKSDPACNDNCPYYELPNVFTPNGDGCNDVFSSFYHPEEAPDVAPCKFVDALRCARFVERVQLHIFNRWGKEVYTYTSDDTKSIYINWDGRGDDGKLLESAIYYYSAEVDFDMIDPSRKRAHLKGLVHLVY
jgi:hypothetical protein